MAAVTEITLALGRTVYGGDQSGEEGSDDKNENEKIEGRETRLSVTWRLTEEEQDLTLMASVLAEEAERALVQAVQTTRKRPNPETSCDERGCDTQAVSRLSNEPNSSGNTGHVSTERQTPTGISTESAHAGNGNGHTPELSHQPAHTYPRAGSGQTAPGQNRSKAPTTNGVSGNGASGYPPYVPPITKTQQLAIQSHCTRHGVADWELRRLLWELFGKKEQRELNKDQAGELLAALQQTILHNGADHSAYAN